jgi:hypothetical protein
MEKKNIHISHAILRAVSIFDPKGKSEKDFAKRLELLGFSKQSFHHNSLDFFKNNYYPEFKELIFSNQEKETVQTFRKEFNQSIYFLKTVFNPDENKNIITPIETTLNYCDLFIFPDGLSFFMLDFSSSNKTISEISDINFMIQKLDAVTKVKIEHKEFNWIEWVEENCLLGNKILSETAGKQIPIDSYSGSKFKLFTVLETKEAILQEQRLELLYDIGCNSRIGTAGGTERESPSKSYYNELMKNTISVFQNYDILPLFDSFTVIGNDILTSNQSGELKDTFAYKTWSDTYFRLVLFNLYLKFNLFKYNAEAKEDSVKTREKFEEFVNKYNFSHISFNFLPNLIIKNHRKTLEIDSELDLFQKRINRISLAIQEKQQGRMDNLIMLITIISSASSIQPIFKVLDNFRGTHHWSPILFYTIATSVFIVLAILVVSFLFPTQLKKTIKKISRYLTKE